MSDLALIIIYNHQYNKNIDILERIYKNRFSHIYHLVPFYDGDKANVIPVYENSIYFQGYIAQGLKSYFNKNYQHYFFVADDMILNPVINENNYREVLRLDSNTCFIPELIKLHKLKDWWERGPEAFNWNINLPRVEAQNQLPDKATALQSFKKFGLEIKPLTFDLIYRERSFPKKLYKIREVISYIRYKINKFRKNKKEYNLPYPMVGAYSDIAVVSSNSIKQFSHYCGVFASTQLFVELAIPTAIVLSAERIVTENDLDYKGKALWTNKDYEELEKYNNSIKNLLENFPSSYLYLHPIKLSKWEIEL